MEKLLTISALCGALLLSGCLGADTGDPRRGGLFGYSPENYERRIQEREDRYQEAREENARLREESASLEQWKQHKQADVAAQKRRLKRVNADIRSLRSRINRLKATPAKAAGKPKIHRPAGATGASEARKAAQIRSMQQELKRLEAEAEALSRM